MNNVNWNNNAEAVSAIAEAIADGDEQAARRMAWQATQHSPSHGPNYFIKKATHTLDF